MDRLTRKELKTDEIAEKAFDLWQWVTVNKTMVIRVGAAVVVIGLAWLGYSLYSSSQATARQAALAKALHLDEATVGATNDQPTAAHFATEDEKNKAAQAAFADVAAHYRGSQEGAIAEMYLAGAAAEKGDMTQAEQRFQGVIDNAPKNYAALATVSLAQLLGSEGKIDQAEKLLRNLMTHPTSTVSKDSAQLALAQILAKTKPEEARKLLAELTVPGQSRGPIIRAALAISADLPQPASIPVALPPAK